MKFKLGDHVLLIHSERKKWLRKIEDKEFHNNYGYVNLADLIDKPYGTVIEGASESGVAQVKLSL